MPEPLPSEIQQELEHIHDNRAPDIVVSYAICASMAYIAVIMRLIARRISKAPLQADDHMILVALVIATGQLIVGCYAVHLGCGKHVILLKDPTAYAKCVIAVEVLYTIGAAAVKFSVLLLYRRVFGSARRFTILLWALGVFILCYSIAQALVATFQCRPINAAWDMRVRGTCVNSDLAAIVPGVINVIADFVTVFLPIPLIWSLHMEKKWRIQLVGIFLLSGFVCIASIYRVTVLNRISMVDASWADVESAIWAMVENCIAIVSASLPTMRPIFNLVVRGHHCSSHERYCSRCEAYKGSSTNDKGRYPPKWPGSESSSGDEVLHLPNNIPPALEIADWSEPVLLHNPKGDSWDVENLEKG
ncbi:hypothetical protein MMC28_001279 [Mycoblastus sanguinarius]|nr:hypothetical protein [Mycoblastus sanguinarius]